VRGAIAEREGTRKSNGKRKRRITKITRRGGEETNKKG
jgi:hypothetical protein